MSFWSKLMENKIVAVAAAGLALGGAIYVAYKQYEKEQAEVEIPVEVLPKPKEFDIVGEINKLKKQMDLQNLTFEDVKKILKLLTDYIKNKTVNLSNKYKLERRRLFPKETRFNRMPEYMKLTSENLMQLQNSVMKLQGEQTQLMASFGLTQPKLAQFAGQLGPYMQELIFSNNITLEDTREHLQLKTQYLQNHGEKLTEALIELTVSLSMQEKQFIPLFLNTIISDQVFEHEPNLDKQQYDIALQQYKNQLGPQIARLEQVLMPLMGRLQTALVGDQMGGMGGYGGYPPNQFQDDGMNGNPMGYSQEAMQQQLELIRQQDPQAYEQLMAMMQAQMR